MRLNRLDLTRYGRFTDVSLNFGPRPVDGPDLHVIYGPNEAGKSTLLDGWLDLLFQIPRTSPMAFIHAYTAMQLGAELEIDGQTHNVVRIKKPSASLLDAKGAPIGEALLQAGLRGLDRGAYSAMFSLNGGTLAEGGESILASQGDLGQLLFSASAGLSDLAARLDKLRSEAEGFLSPSGRKGRLLELKSEFDALGERIKEMDTAAGDYARLAAARDAAHAAWQKAGAEAETAIARSLDLERLIGALPLAERLRQLDERIAGFADLPVPPPGWIDDLGQLDRAQTEFATRIETAAGAVRGLEDQLQANPPDTGVLDLAEAIAAAERLKSGHDAALDDLPRRSKERDGETGAIMACLARLGRPGAEPAALLPEAGVQGSLRGLIEQWSGVDTRLATAARELEDAQAEAAEAERQLLDAGGSPADPGGLVGLVARLRRDDPVGTLDRARTERTEVAALLQDAMDDLRPWTGDAVELAALPRPEAGWLDGIRTGLAAAERKAERAAAEVARLTEDVARAEARLGQADSIGTVTLDQAAEVRAGRESLWARHRAALNAETADRFEAAMRLDDQIAAAVSDLRAQAEKTNESQAALAEKRQELQAAQAQADAAQAERDGLRQSLAEAVARVSDAFAADMTVEDFAAWLGRRDTAREAARKSGAAYRRAAEALARLDRERADLLAALAQAGHTLDPETGFSPAFEAAQSLLDRETRQAALRESGAKAELVVARRQAALTKAQAAADDWHDRWTAACGETYLAGAPPDVSAMRAILDELGKLQVNLDKHADLDLRIRKMEDNRDRFTKAVAGVAQTLGLAENSDTAAAWRAIVARLRRAEDIANTQLRLRDQLATARKGLADLERDAALHQRTVTEISDFFGVLAWPEAREALGRAGERGGLTENRNASAEDLCARMRCADVAEALEQLQGLESAELQAKAATVKSDQETLTATRQEAYAAFKEAERQVAAVGGDGAVAELAEERQTLLLEIEEGARAHLRRRLGILAVDNALRRYRDTHRSGMLERASEAFRTMSRDRYTGLAAQPDGTGEMLVALAADGGSKAAPQLSDGTRAQLYLALRIAGYHEFVRSNGPVPFIADDIMESFDDDRTVEAFGLLDRMSRSGQVIYLTHHAHVCAIAKAVCPDVHLHRLDP